MARLYAPRNLIPALRHFAKAREQALAAGFTDNGGAIHSIERILDILCAAVCYPDVAHIKDLKRHPLTQRSRAAHRAIALGKPVHLEHVMPRRAYAKQVIRLLDEGKSDQALVAFIRRTYRLVLLTPTEMRALNRINRSRMTSDRIAEAGIELHEAKRKVPRI